VDGTIVKEPGKTGSQWRILYSITLPSFVCDFFEMTATIGEGSGESLNRLPVGPHELILADAGYCSVAGIEYVWQNGTDALVRVNPQSFVAYSAYGRRISLNPERPISRNELLSEVWGVPELSSYPDRGQPFAQAAAKTGERPFGSCAFQNRPQLRLQVRALRRQPNCG
jgi:hypothetical protein